MTMEATCPPCGAVLDADNADGLVAKMQAHAKEAHGEDLDREHVLASAREV